MNEAMRPFLLRYFRYFRYIRLQVERVNEAMRPFLLRRMKVDVETSVPPKEETIVEVELTAIQKQVSRDTCRVTLMHLLTVTITSTVTPTVTPTATSTVAQYYRAIFERNVDFLSSGSSHTPSLMNVVMELRKCCNHPFLIEGAERQACDVRNVRNHPLLIEGAVV